MAAGAEGCEVAHSHTWYANLGGHLAKLLYAIPHVATVHSLEPLRPWKEEQLGGGYRLSSWCERIALENADAVIAVSNGTKRDILGVYPGDRPRARARDLQRDRHRASTRPTRTRTCWSATASTRASRRSCSSGGSRARRASSTCWRRRRRSTRAPSSCCARARPTRRSWARTWPRGWSELQATREGVIWLEQMLPKPEVIQLLSHATVFACPSIYEPLGIVNLEAMACEAAVVATATGGIVEVVEDERDRLPRADRAGRRRHRRAARPGALRRRLRRARQRAGRRPGRGPRRWARPAARGRSSTSPGPRSPQQTSKLYRSLR